MSGADARGRLRAIGLSLPDATLDDGHPPHLAFKVGSKAFAWYTENEHGNGRIELRRDSYRLQAPKRLARLVD